jgi:RNA polymerase subunit RPABC4/transcription elongation factor Spt4
MNDICPHCGVEEARVERCDGYRSPHLCPNDHIDHARPDLFCRVCGLTTTEGVCPQCSKTRETPEYIAYKKKVSEIGIRRTDLFCFWDDYDCVVQFLEGIPPEDCVDDEVSCWDE